VKYSFIFEHPEYPKAKWAVHMKISKSGYYHWKRTHVQREKRKREYAERVRREFMAGEGTYGASRICGRLRTEGFACSFYRVRDFMDMQGLRSIHRKRRQRSLTDSRKARGDGYANLTKDLQIDTPFQVLSSDISYIRTGEGFDYLCQVKDVKSGIILAESMSDHMKAELVVKTIQKALRRWNIPMGCIFHSDRGSQYTSESVMNLLAKESLRQSFSRVGMPGDNSWSESFFANLKKETVHWTHFRTREEARQKIFAYIEGFYNTRRVQKRLGYLSPLQWLTRWNQSLLENVA
jgi:putative transposase